MRFVIYVASQSMTRSDKIMVVGSSALFPAEISGMREMILKQEERKHMSTLNDREDLQKVFANRFKADIEKESFKTSAKRILFDFMWGIIFMIIFAAVLFLSATHS